MPVTALSRALPIGAPDRLHSLWRIGLAVSIYVCGWLAFIQPWACAVASLVIGCAVLGRVDANKAISGVLHLDYLPTGIWRLDCDNGSSLELQPGRTSVLPRTVFAELSDPASQRGPIKVAVTAASAGALAFCRLSMHLRVGGRASAVQD